MNKLADKNPTSLEKYKPFSLPCSCANADETAKDYSSIENSSTFL